MHKKGKIPNKEGVYAYIEDGNVIYIGRSEKLGNRAKSHPFSNYHKCKLHYWKTKSSAKAESILINIYKPKYNGQRPVLPNSLETVPSFIDDLLESYPPKSNRYVPSRIKNAISTKVNA